MNRTRTLIATAVCAVALTGCMTPHVAPGTVETGNAKLTQPQNPKDTSSLDTESTKTVEFIVPAGSTIEQIDPVTRTPITVTVLSNTPVRITTNDKVNSRLGGADMSIGKMIAKLKSMKWVQMVGIVVFLFGVASFAWPPLRVVIGSVTTSAMISAAGLGLVVLPLLIVGNELLILGGCLGAAGLYFFIHRYGKKSGEVEVFKKWVDKNNNGKVDPGEIVS